jgi:hypothetical protein
MRQSKKKKSVFLNDVLGGHYCFPLAAAANATPAAAAAKTVSL